MKRYLLIFVVAFLVAVVGLTTVASGDAQAALVFHSGFETGDFTEWGSVTGSPAVVETQKKTGSYAMQCDTTGGAATAYVTAGAAGVTRVTFYLYIVTAPNSECIIVGNAAAASVRLTNDRYLKLYYLGNLKITGGTQLATNTWYRVSASVESIPNLAKLYLNGVQEGDEGTNVNDSFVRTLGVTSSVTADLYFDDYASDNTSSTADLGDIRVAAASPNAAGQYAQYDSVSGFGNVDEIPANDADFIEDDGADVARESYNIPDLSTLAGASSGDTVNAVSVWIRGDRDGGGATVHKSMVRDNGSDYEPITPFAFDSIAWFNWYLAVMPDDSAAWSEARFNSLQIGAYHSGAQDQRVHCLVAMVAYTPTAEGEADISNAPTAWSVNSGTPIATSTDYWSSGSEPSWPLDDGECHFTVTNNGGTCSITVKGTNFTGGVGWTLAGTPAENTVTMKAGKSGDALEVNMVVLTTSEQSFISGLAGSATKKWELLLESATSHTDGAGKTGTVTLTATLD